MLSRIKTKIYAILTEIRHNRPLLIIILFTLVIHTIGVGWGLPNKDSWAIDSVAPLGVIKGLSQGFSFGYVYHYPIVHLVLLAILYLPVLLVGAADAAISNSWQDVMNILSMANKGSTIETFQLLDSLINIDLYATILILIARVVSILMSLGVVYLVYRIARELFNEKTGLAAAFLISFNPVFNYYSHFANLDVPYLFWSLIVLYYLIKIVKYNTRKDYIYCAVFTTISFGTKDQAYALFIIPFIVYLFITPLFKREGTENKKKSILSTIFRKDIFVFAGVLLACTVLVENLILNYSGFMGKLHQMLGPGSKDYASYTSNTIGTIRLSHDMFTIFTETLTIPLTILAFMGIFLLFYTSRKEKYVLNYRLIFLYSTLSFSIFFNAVVLRSDDRFLLPQTLFMTVYAGYVIAFLYEKLKGKLKYIFTGILVIFSIYLFYFTISVNANFLIDTRYTARDWMDEHIAPGSSIEHYSWYAYLPIFGNSFKPNRVKKDFFALDKRNPDYIILTSRYYTRFIKQPQSPPPLPGKKISTRSQDFLDSDAARYINGLLNNKFSYRLEKTFQHRIPFFKDLGIAPDHILIYKRVRKPQ